MPLCRMGYARSLRASCIFAASVQLEGIETAQDRE